MYSKDLFYHYASRLDICLFDGFTFSKICVEIFMSCIDLQNPRQPFSLLLLLVPKSRLKKEPISAAFQTKSQSSWRDAFTAIFFIFYVAYKTFQSQFPNDFMLIRLRMNELGRWLKYRSTNSTILEYFDPKLQLA